MQGDPGTCGGALLVHVRHVQGARGPVMRAALAEGPPV